MKKDRKRAWRAKIGDSGRRWKLRDLGDGFMRGKSPLKIISTALLFEDKALLSPSCLFLNCLEHSLPIRRVRREACPPGQRVELSLSLKVFKQ